MRRYQIYQHEQTDTWVLIDLNPALVITIGTREEVEAVRQLREDNAEPISPPKLVAIPSSEPVMQYPEGRTLMFFALVVMISALILGFLFLGGE